MKKFVFVVAIILVAMAIVLFAGKSGKKNKRPKTLTLPMEQRVNIFDYSEKISQNTTPNLFSDGFRFEIQNGDESVEANGLGRAASEQNSAEGQERAARAEEWGYSLVALDGITDGMGRSIKSTIAGDKKPKTREEAVEKIKEYLDNQYKSKSLSGVYYSMNGHFPWHHYAAEDGFDVLGSEVGENINNYQWHIALNRGAAKQYDKAWFIDFSMWYEGSVREYTVANKKWGDYSSPSGGHSLSLFERTMLMSYMSGAPSLVAEAGGYIVYDDNGNITPYGESCKKLNSFMEQTDRGVSYTPFALVLDFYHGTYSGVTKKLAFNTFKYQKGDKMTDRIINMLWDDSIKRNGGSEDGALVNNGRGDLYDVLLQNADSETLNNYPCIILSGNIDFSQEDIEKFTCYAENGGTLVLNRAYASSFPVLSGYSMHLGREDISLGSGRVILYGEDYRIGGLDEILKELTAQYVPFSFSEDVEYLVNVRDNSILLTLINNEGVTKTHWDEETVDNGKDIDLTVNFNGVQKIKSVSAIYGGQKLTNEKNSVTLTVPAGQAVILEYDFGE